MPFTIADERQAMRLISGHDYAVIDTKSAMTQKGTREVKSRQSNNLRK
jgi:chromosome partitioning protein